MKFQKLNLSSDHAPALAIPQLQPSQAQEAQLENQLQDFGLNPTHWMVHHLKDHFFCVIHRWQDDFVLIGWVERLSENYKWGCLEVLDPSL